MFTPPTEQNELTDLGLSLINETISVRVCNTQERGRCIIVDNCHGRAEISVFGGQVLSFIKKADARERLWLSELAVFDGKTPIRGGVPICWPWFSRHSTNADYPSHGYARTQLFCLEDVNETLINGKVTSSQLTLKPHNEKQYGYEISMRLIVTISDTLHITITSTNVGDEPITLTQALHSYFLVDDINQVQLKGLNTPYDDSVNATQKNVAPRDYTFSEEVDRIHNFIHDQHENTLTLRVVQRMAQNTQANSHESFVQCIEQSGHDSIVVWNPWVSKSLNMKDMQNNGYKTMLCVEAANIFKADCPLILAPSQSHSLSQRFF